MARLCVDVPDFPPGPDIPTELIKRIETEVAREVNLLQPGAGTGKFQTKVDVQADGTITLGNLPPGALDASFVRFALLGARKVHRGPFTIVILRKAEEDRSVSVVPEAPKGILTAAFVLITRIVNLGRGGLKAAADALALELTLLARANGATPDEELRLANSLAIAANPADETERTAATIEAETIIDNVARRAEARQEAEDKLRAEEGVRAPTNGAPTDELRVELFELQDQIEALEKAQTEPTFSSSLEFIRGLDALRKRAAALRAELEARRPDIKFIDLPPVELVPVAEVQAEADRLRRDIEAAESAQNDPNFSGSLEFYRGLQKMRDRLSFITTSAVITPTPSRAVMNSFLARAFLNVLNLTPDVLVEKAAHAALRVAEGLGLPPGGLPPARRAAR